jgi:thiol:disulfide interchange protein
MNMRIRQSLKPVIVAVPCAAWLMQADAGTWSTIALVVGAAYVAFAWVVFTPRARQRPAAAALAATVTPAVGSRCFEQRHGAQRNEISHRPTRRGPRDLRCPASRTTARRSTRR